jgi:AcrR family transcriptional regulator
MGMMQVAKEEKRAVKRNEILDAAQQLIYTKGYELMSIQDILDTLHISKGAFYHYFNSKQDLLDGLVERTLEHAEQLIRPVVEDPCLTALEKLHLYFATAAHWKTAQKSFMLAMLRVWYTDQNAIVRQKQLVMSLKRVAPLVTDIIRQGVAEGVFCTNYPDDTSLILMNLLAGLGNTWAEILLADPRLPDALPRVVRLWAAYNEAMERVLGVPAGTLKLLDDQTIMAWAAAD